MSFGRNHSKDITFLLRFLLPQRKLGMPLDFCSDSFFSRNLFCLPIKSHLRQKEVWSPGSWSLPKYGSYFLVDLFFGIFWCYSIFRSRWFCVWFPKPRSFVFSFKYTGCCPNFTENRRALCFSGLLTPRSWLRTSWKTRRSSLWSLLFGWVLGYFTRFRVSKPTNIGGKSLIQKLLHPWKLT